MIRSPNFPNSYPRGVERFWTVVAPVGNRIKATFNAFHLGECGNRKCNISFDCDMLEVRDGALNTSKMIGRFCGNRRPNGFYSSGNVLWIRFKSSIKPTNGSLGFEAIFSTGKLFSRWLSREGFSARKTTLNKCTANLASVSDDENGEKTEF